MAQKALNAQILPFTGWSLRMAQKHTMDLKKHLKQRLLNQDVDFTCCEWCLYSVQSRDLFIYSLTHRKNTQWHLRPTLRHQNAQHISTTQNYDFESDCYGKTCNLCRSDVQQWINKSLGIFSSRQVNGAFTCSSDNSLSFRLPSDFLQTSMSFKS